MRDPASTASGLTVLTRIPNCPPSSARQRARCASAALAVEYAAAFLPATSAFLLATKTRLPPRPCASKSRKPSRATRKYPVASTFQFLFHSAKLVSVIDALDASPALLTNTSTPPKESWACAKAARTLSSLVTSIFTATARLAPKC